MCLTFKTLLNAIPVCMSLVEFTYTDYVDKTLIFCYHIFFQSINFFLVLANRRFKTVDILHKNHQTITNHGFLRNRTIGTDLQLYFRMSTLWFRNREVTVSNQGTYLSFHKTGRTSFNYKASTGWLQNNCHRWATTEQV
jgi:hypothetical protein